MDPDDQDDALTAPDISTLNLAAVERSAASARLAGAALVVVGALGVLAGFWVEVRTQNRFGALDLTFGSEGPSSGGPTLAQRIDLVAGSSGLLLTAGAVIGIGLLLALCWPPVVASVAACSAVLQPRRIGAHEVMSRAR